MLHDAVRDHVAGMHDVLVVCFEVDLVNQAFAAEGEKAAAGNERITPMGETLALISPMLMIYMCSVAGLPS